MIHWTFSASRSKGAKRFGMRTFSCRIVLHRNGSEWGELDYQRHILPGVDWQAIEAPDPQRSFPESARWQWATVDVGQTLPVFHAERELYIDKTVRISWYARRLGDVIPRSVASWTYIPSVGGDTEGSGRF